jgi:hypothetical protein
MKNTKGQMHVLEVLLVATLFTSTINVAVSVLPTSDANNFEENDLYFTGLEILEILDEWAPANSTIAAAHHDSTLSWWLATDNHTAIRQYLDSHGSQTESIVDRTVHSGPVTQTFRLVWADDELWELNLQLWYGYRED